MPRSASSPYRSPWNNIEPTWTIFFQNDITICHNISGDLIQSKASGVHSMVRSAQLCPRKPGWCPSLKARNLSERTAPRFLGRYVMRSLGNLLTPNYSGWWFGPFYIFPWVNFITTSSGDRNQGRWWWMDLGNPLANGRTIQVSELLWIILVYPDMYPLVFEHSYWNGCKHSEFSH